MKRKIKKKLNEKKILFLLLTGLFVLISFTKIYPQTTLQTNDSLRPILLKSVGISWTRESGEELFSSSFITQEEIKQSQGNGSINNLFDLVPSMITTSDAGTGIGYTYMRIRGIDQTRINVTINGIALNDAESQGSWFVNLPDFGSHVKNLQIQRGVGTSNHGAAAFGATMNFATQNENRKPFFELSSSVGSFYTFRNAISAGTGLLNQQFSANVHYSNILSRGYIDRADAKLHSFFFNSDYHILSSKSNKDYGKLSFNVIYGKEKTGLAWNGVPSDSLKTNRTYNSCGEYYDENGIRKYYENESDNYEQGHYQLFYAFNKNFIGDKKEHFLKVDFATHLTRGMGYYESYKYNKKLKNYGLTVATPSNDTIKKTDLITRKFLDNHFYGFTFNVEHQISDFLQEGKKRNSFSWSLGGAWNQYDGDHYGHIIWMKYAGNTPVNYPWYKGNGNKKQLNLFGTFSYNLNNQIYTYVDLQYRHIHYLITGIDDNLLDIGQQYIWNFFNPKAGFNYSWKNNTNTIEHSIYTSLALSHREPTRADLVDSPEEQKPVPERMFDVEFGYRIKDAKMAFNINGYYMYYINQLVLTGEINDVGAALMKNVPYSYRSGIELIAAYQPLHFFQWKINGTFSLNKILHYTEYVDNWDTGLQEHFDLGTTNISFSPAIIASNSFIFTPLKDFKIGLVTKVVGKQYLDNSSNENYMLKPYSITHVHLNYTFHTKAVPEIGLFFSIYNIFNSSYSSNAWLYKYYEGGIEKYLDGYFTQAGINFLGGIRVRF